MDDRELLELAAKAAGYPSEWKGKIKVVCDAPRYERDWNPLCDDGDALRLAVKLRIQIWHRPSGVEGVWRDSVLTSPKTESLSPDPYAATRRAIVRAAADMGRAMP